MDTSAMLDEGVQEIGTAITPFGELRILRGNYPVGGAPFVHLVGSDYGDVATLSVNIPEENQLLNDGEFFVKDWNENQLLVDFILATGLFEETGRSVSCGYVNAPVWRFK